MAVPRQTVQELSAVQASLNYLVNDGERPVVYINPPEDGTPQRTGQFQAQTVSIADGRPIADSLLLDREGFELRPHITAVADFYDDEAIRSVYYPEVERLLKAATGATRVHIFDHTVRVESTEKRDEKAVRAPVQVVHNDYTLRSGPQRVRDLIDPAEADVFLKNHFAEINVWRSIGESPVQTTPLAVADAQSIALGDFIATDLVYQDRTGEIYQVTFNPGHQWYYFSEMHRNEVLLLKCFDSATDGRARFTAHTAFDNSTAAPDAPPRESIEVRTLISFAPEFA